MWESLHRPVPDWFRDAKFGLFYHWGPYSVPACQNEWYSRNMYCKGLPQNRWHEEHYGKLSEFGYKDFYASLTGERFDPEEWADLALRAGAKYAGPVTEHGDNFSMFASTVNPVNCVSYGPRRDVSAECAKEMRKRGIKVLSTFHHQWLWGWFMSTDPDADVYDPANEMYYGPALPLETCRYIPFRLPDAKFCRIWAEKVREAVELLEPDVLYFDSRACIIDERVRRRTVEHYYAKVPGGILTYKQEDFPAEVGALDIELGRVSEARGQPWQTDDRLEDNVTWCIVQQPKYRRAADVIHQLCDVVSKNGNLLLNVGPKTDGSIHEDAARELHAVGDWLKVCGEAIYGSRPWTVAAEGPAVVRDEDYGVEKISRQAAQGGASGSSLSGFGPRDIRFTRKDGAVFAVALGWPDDGKLLVRSMPKGSAPPVGRVALLGAGDLAFEQDETGLHVTLPQRKPCEHAFAFKIYS